MTIRPYQASDRNRCLEIFYSNCPHYLDPTEIEGLKNWLNGQDQGIITYPTSAADFFYVLQVNDEVIACGGFYLVRDQPIVNMVWGLVENKYHKQGYGRLLFLYRMQQIQTLFPQHTIQLDTSQHTYRFFEQLGFHVTAVTQNAYGPGLHRYDMVK